MVATGHLQHRRLSTTLKDMFWLVLAMVAWQQMQAQNGPLPSTELSLIYFDSKGIEEVKKRLLQRDTYYIQALEEVTRKADQLIDFNPDPVVNKTKIPPSGDKHDYLSIGPYWWPDTTKVDGLPWVRRDGEVNPNTRGNHTDKLRLSRMFDAINHLSWAYHYSQNSEYGEKALDIIRTWFVDTATRVNPNVDFGQGVPAFSQ